MNPFALLFGFSGRINRAKFWLAALIYVVFFFGVIGIAMLMLSSLDTMFIAALLAYVPLIVSGLAVGIKRLHDRDKSGWWLLLFYLAPLLINLFGIYVLGDAGTLNSILMVVSFAINIWAAGRARLPARHHRRQPVRRRPAGAAARAAAYALIALTTSARRHHAAA